MAALRQIKPADAGDLHRRPARRRGGRRAAHEAAAALDEGARRELRRHRGQRQRSTAQVFLGMLAEALGTFFLRLGDHGRGGEPARDQASGPRSRSAARSAWRVMVIAPLTGAGFNPARAFGPALVSGEFGGAGDFLLVYVLGPRARRAASPASLYFQTLHRARARRARTGVGAGRLGRRRTRPSVDSRLMRRVTFSRNFTLSLSRTCRCYCKYCAFATHRAHLYAPDEVERLLDDAARRGVEGAAGPHRREAGGQPRGGRAARASTGTRTSTSYVAWACERALERGHAAAHEPRRRCRARSSARLREVTASQGLMLESVNPDLVVHQGSPTKHPARRLRDDPRGRRAADPVHQRDPRGHRRDARRSAWPRSRRWPRCTPSTATSRR